MCGIAGIHSPTRPPEPRELQAMVDAMRHRGPDGSGLHIDGPAGLAHARLAIIDVAGGHQPLANEDGTVWVSFNGEIFNYLELRAELLARGHSFTTHSDTEVLVHLYEEHGDDFLQHLNGQFALALWDARRERLLLARDRAGIRPLFHVQHNGRFAFASEAKALFALPEVPRRLDADGLASVFSWWSALPPGTVFEGVQSLPPGHLLVCDASGQTVRRWWDWDFTNDPAAPTDDDALADELHALLIDAVRLQLRADVPVGAYLSGGLDSSIVTTIIRRHTDTPLRSFSLTFDDAEFDESAHQQAMVAHLGTAHSSIGCSRAHIAAGFARTVWHAETPLVRAAPTPMMRLAGSVRAAGYKVVLTGEGADEVFGGYDLFKEAKVRRFIARQSGSPRRRRLVERLYPYLATSPAASRALSQGFFAQGLDAVDRPGFAHMTRLATTRRVLPFFTPEWQQRLAGYAPQAALDAMLPAGFNGWPALGRDQYVEANTLMSGYLLSSQGDRMAMAASIEARFPFLDHRVIEFAGRLPPRLKIRGLLEKRLLKNAFAHELPASITQRSKQPYRVPDSASFFADGRALPWVAELLSAERLRADGLFDAEAVGKLLAKCAAGRATGFGDNMAFMGVLSTQLLHEQFIRPGGALVGAGVKTLVHSGFEQAAARVPGKLALIVGEQRITYAELAMRVQAVAAALAEAGVQPGDRVLVFLDSGVEFAAAMWAVWRQGAVLVPVSSLTKADKLAFLLADTEASVLLTQATLAAAWQPAVERAPALRGVWVAGGVPAGSAAVCCAWPAAQHTEVRAQPTIAPDDSSDALAALIYTSGTTGQPKGVMLSHANMCAAWRAVQAYLELRDDDVIGLTLSPAFSYGLYHLVIGLGIGATVLIERNAAFPAKLLHNLVSERVTVFPGVPTLFAALLELDLTHHDLGALRLITNAAAPLPPAHLARLREALPRARFYSMYGLTECKRASYLPPEELDRRPASVGRGMPFQQHWLVDAEGRRLPAGATGELVVSGPHVMQGYWRRPEETAQRLRPGPQPGTVVLHTGDIFRSDAEGWLYFVSRSDDIIKTRGEKVSPVEVEHCICLLPQVLEAAVTGIADERLGQAVKAYVRLRPGATLTEREVIRHRLARLESFMAPKAVAFVDTLPMTDSGKLRRASLGQLSEPPDRPR